MADNASSSVDDDSNAPWWVYLVYLSTLVPWAVMQVFDAIDGKRRHVNEVPLRLFVSLCMVTASTTMGLVYVAWTDGRDRNEAATMLLGVALNSWHWRRNFRGWRSLFALLSQKERVCELLKRLMVMRLQGMSGNGFPLSSRGSPPSLEAWMAHWHELWVNDSVIDNDPRVSPASLASSSKDAIIAGDILWRMFWLQGAAGRPNQDEGAHIDSQARLAAVFDGNSPPSHGERNLLVEEALDRLIRMEIEDYGRVKSVPYLRSRLDAMSRADQDRLKAQAEVESEEDRANWVPPTAEDRKYSLQAYDVGQQDIGGLPPAVDYRPDSLQMLWCTMSWVTASAPRPLENIWYESSALEHALQKKAIPGSRFEATSAAWPRFPIVAEWYHIAGDLARQRDIPLLLSVKEGKRYALRLAAVSAILAYNFEDYMALCCDIHRLGITARWTHGWSGLISCYSKYWTLGNVSIALLGGLSLLVLTGDGRGNDDVRCMLVGIASEIIMSTYLSDTRRAARTQELERRYLQNKGKTCRGSGVRCIRNALDALDLPRSASQLDGVIAFTSGWAMEAVHGLPGNQAPRDGNDHGQIEDLYCSSRAYRFPDERL